MKQFLVSVALLLQALFAISQQVGSRVSFVAVDGKSYTGVITEVQANQYKVKYDGFDYSAWLQRAWFTVTDNQQGFQSPTVNNFTIIVLGRDDQPLADAKVTVGGQEIYSNSGRIDYKNYLNIINVSASGYQTQKVDLRSYQPGATVTIYLSKLPDVMKPLHVYVKDRNNNPIANAVVTVSPGSSAVSNGSGLAVAQHKQQPGEYITVRVSAQGYKDQQKRVLSGENRETFGGFGAIRTPDDEVTFILEKGQNDRNILHIVVEVLDAESNKPVNGASVKLQLSDGTSQSGTSNSNGEAKFTDNEYGYTGTTARVMVTHKDYKEKWSDITEDLMTAKDADQRQFVVYVTKKETTAGTCSAENAAIFSKLAGSWKSYRLHVNIGGSCDHVTGTWKVTEWCEGVDATNNPGTARVEGTFTGDMEGGVLRFHYKSPPSPHNSKGTEGEGSCQISSFNGLLNCSGLGCSFDPLNK